MKLEIVRRLYNDAEEICATNGIADAWIFEKVFADLIVLECAWVAENVYPEGAPLRLVSSGFGNAIKEHFGLKE